MNTQTTFADKFDAVMTHTVDYYMGETYRIKSLFLQVRDQMETVVEWARKVYQPGDDFYGWDYLNQQFSPEQKMILQEIMDENLPFDIMAVELNKLSAALRKMEKYLKEEYEFSNPY